MVYWVSLEPHPCTRDGLAYPGIILVTEILATLKLATLEWQIAIAWSEMSKAHSQLQSSVERVFEEGSPILSYGLNYLPYFLEEFGCHSWEVDVFVSVILFEFGHQSVKVTHLVR